MQVLESHALHAICQDGNKIFRSTPDGSARPIQVVGCWSFTTAREILDVETAAQMRDAVNAVNRVMRGNPQIEDLFDGLIDREPSFPEHLKHLIGG